MLNEVKAGVLGVDSQAGHAQMAWSTLIYLYNEDMPCFTSSQNPVDDSWLASIVCEHRPGCYRL